MKLYLCREQSTIKSKMQSYLSVCIFSLDVRSLSIPHLVRFQWADLTKGRARVL